jgi:membrane carboxypeptidase/penicillin-binding protein PbpC
MERCGYPIAKIPSHNPDCPSLIAKNPPIITSPSGDSEYYLRDWVDKAHQKIALDASVPSDVKKLYWFINGEFFASISPKERLFYPPVIGRHIIKCMDDRGLSTEVTLKVY